MTTPVLVCGCLLVMVLKGTRGSDRDLLDTRKTERDEIRCRPLVGL